MYYKDWKDYKDWEESTRYGYYIELVVSCGAGLGEGQSDSAYLTLHIINNNTQGRILCYFNTNTKMKLLLAVIGD